MELEEDIKEAEKQSQNLREQIQQIELKLNESKKLLFTTYSLWNYLYSFITLGTTQERG